MVARKGQRADGFTLIEIAVVIAIIGALLGTLLVPLATQIEATKIKATDRDMESIREALIGYAMANGRLPCPDHDGDGLEDRDLTSTLSPDSGPTLQCDSDTTATGVTPDYLGWLPHADLGVGASDAWGRKYLYEVSPEFTYEALNGQGTGVANQLDMGDTGTLTVQTRTDDPATVVVETRATQIIGNAVPAVIVSAGPNGYGATTSANTVITDPDVTTDETRDERGNRDTDSIYMFRTQTIEGAACDDAVEADPFCEFDDRVAWLSSSLLFNRLVTAGVLP